MSGLSIGLSALTATQQALDVTGQNIANAGTAGYHRQVATLAERAIGGVTGDGVDVESVTRVVSSALDQAVASNTADAHSLSAQLTPLQQVQTTLNPTDGSLSSLLEGFFNQAEQLTTNPADPTQRQVVLNAAGALADGFNSVANQFATLSAGLDAQASQGVDTVNQLAAQIASLNAAIQRTTLQRGNASGLSDQRDQLIAQMAQTIDVRTAAEPNGQVAVIAGGVPIVLGDQAIPLKFSINSSDQEVVTAGGTQTPLTVTGGDLGGTLQVRNSTIPDLQNRLNTMLRGLVRGVDEVQATGLGQGGPMTQVSGQRAVSNVKVPLAQAGLALPPQAGSLYVSVTNQATGARSLTQINIDPATQSLQDVATALSAVPNLQAVVDPQTRTLQILAQPGYAVDFAGRMPTAPQSVAMTGTATPQIGGTYTGTTNGAYTFRVVGAGTIGVTPNLSLQVQDSSGAVVGSLNIGQGYSPGSTLAAPNGVTVQMSAGTVNAGDSFAVPVVANSDTAGLLPALGLNTLFTGDNISDLQVSPDLQNNPNGLSAGTTGQAADASNLQRLAALRDAPLPGGTQTPSQALAGLVGSLGSQVQDLTSRQSAASAAGQMLQAEQQNVSGVDPNEELVRMLQFQQGFQMAARYVSVINDTLNTLVNILS